MQYLLMICGDETAEEHANDGCGGWIEDLERRGKIRGGGGLRPPAEATTIRVRDGEVLLTDGPFTEAKEQIGGFVVLDCADLDEALELAARHPAATYGSIEVRPMLGPEDFA
ncbi:YciI family protein [Amycolatopsis kentuckyensis]|uniref:YciI family protein n=1 Tax=Amycolatopsis kentuckyensis TaxID=218823 RepID=UPI000A364408|nr:YciI family protein [Amycolatopsis kentuckyensis]